MEKPKNAPLIGTTRVNVLVAYIAFLLLVSIGMFSSCKYSPYERNTLHLVRVVNSDLLGFNIDSLDKYSSSDFSFEDGPIIFKDGLSYISEFLPYQKEILNQSYDSVTYRMISENKVEVSYISFNWMILCFEIPYIEKIDIYEVEKNEIVKITSKSKNELLVDSLSVIGQEDFYEWLDHKRLNDVFDENNEVITEKYLNYLKLFCQERSSYSTS